MRSYVFTERERRLLSRWLETGEETGDVPRILTWIRQNTLQLAEDLTLLLEAVRKLQRQHRWRGRITGRSEFGSALRLAESGLTRARRGAATSAASRG